MTFAKQQGVKKEPGDGIVVAIDGPSGAGKSSVAKQVASRLGMEFLDTGAMYRALTYWALEQNVALSDQEKLTQLAKKIPLELNYVQGVSQVKLAGQEVSDQIRSPEVTAAVSEVSAHGQVRQALISLQRQIIAQARYSGTGIVAEGRDITTVVAPEAQVRILLTADQSVRQARRGMQEGNASQAGIQARDQADSKVNNFLTPAPGVTLLDSTDLDFEQTVGKVIELVRSSSSF